MIVLTCFNHMKIVTVLMYDHEFGTPMTFCTLASGATNMWFRNDESQLQLWMCQEVNRSGSEFTGYFERNGFSLPVSRQEKCFGNHIDVPNLKGVPGYLCENYRDTYVDALKLVQNWSAKFHGFFPSSERRCADPSGAHHGDSIAL